MNALKINKTLIALLVIASLLLTLTACGEKTPDPTRPPQPTSSINTGNEQNDQTAFLGKELYITDVGNYTGAYMEDGSDEVVANVLMIVLENKSQSALQLARISLDYADFTASFEATNVPAGASVVLLEKNRHEYVPDTFFGARADQVAFFQEPMSLQEDKVKVTGINGALTVENLTDEVLGEIYIYYKNSASDGLFYGGITYRARVESGLKPGKNTTVMTNHYYPEACSILNVQIMPITE